MLLWVTHQLVTLVDQQLNLTTNCSLSSGNWMQPGLECGAYFWLYSLVDLLHDFHSRWKVCGSVSCLNQSPLIVPERLWHTNIPISCSEPSAPRRGHCSVRHEAWAGLCAERSSGIPLTSPNIGAAGSWPTMIFECVASSIEVSTKFHESFYNIWRRLLLVPSPCW